MDPEEVDFDTSVDESVGDVHHIPPLQNVPAPIWRCFGEAIASTASTEFNEAMLRVHLDLEALLIADRANPFTKSRFASLGNLLATVRPVLNRHGFLPKQFSGTIRSHGSQAKRWYSTPIITLIVHVQSGQWEAVVVDLPTETTVYSHASSQTFGKRYGLQSYLCIATVDDDGAAAIQNRIDETHNAKVVEAAVDEIKKCKTIKELNKWLEENRDGLNNIPDGPGLSSIRGTFSERKKHLESATKPLVEAS